MDVVGAHTSSPSQRDVVEAFYFPHEIFLKFWFE